MILHFFDDANASTNYFPESFANSDELPYFSEGQRREFLLKIAEYISPYLLNCYLCSVFHADASARRRWEVGNIHI